MLLCGHLIKSWCRQQKVTKLYSAEAEHYVLVCASCEGLGIAAFGLDLGVRYEIEAFTDATAALGILPPPQITSAPFMPAGRTWASVGVGKSSARPDATSSVMTKNEHERRACFR